MPCKSFICEFCDTTFRADAIAVHIKAKHMAELKQFILNDFKEYNHNYIQSYCNNSSVYSMDSKRHDGCSYVFGVKPAFFEDNPKSNSEMSQYLSSSENKLKHREFIGDIIKSITLMEFIDFQKDLFVRSPEKDKMAKEIKDITIKANNLELSLSSKQHTIERLKQENMDFKEYYETKDTIEQIMDANKTLRNQAERHHQEIDRLRESLSREQRDASEIVEENNRRNNSELDYYMTQADTMAKELKKAKETIEKFNGKVKAEAEKLFEAEKKQKKKAKKQLERAKLLAKLAQNDSDEEKSD